MLEQYVHEKGVDPFLAMSFIRPRTIQREFFLIADHDTINEFEREVAQLLVKYGVKYSTRFYNSEKFLGNLSTEMRV